MQIKPLFGMAIQRSTTVPGKDEETCNLLYVLD
jgi:hypothetical protein